MNRKTIVRSLKMASVLGSGLLSVPGSGLAQTTQGLEEIVVTARRVAEKLQTVPVAVTALDAAKLEQQRVVSIEDLDIVPGLHVSQFQSPDQLIVAIRGQRNTHVDPGQDPAIGVYFADVPTGFQWGENLGLFDLSDIQVLKGPQGTLFGRNSTGGAVLINPKKPTDIFEGSARIGYVNTYEGNGFTTTSVLNLPINEKLRMRVALDTVDQDGWEKNLATPAQIASANLAPPGNYPWPYGKTDGSPGGAQDSQVWRISIDAAPTDDIDNYFVYEGTNYSGNNTAVQLENTYRTVGGRPSVLPTFYGFNNYFAQQKVSGDFWSSMWVAKEPNRITQNQFVDTFSWDLGENLIFKNIAGFKETHRLSTENVFGVPVYLADIAFNYSGYEYSEEAQLQGRALDDKLKWVAGLFYFRNKTNAPNFGTYLAYDLRTGTAHSSTVAGYAQGTYELPWVDGLSLTLGARYTMDKRSLAFSQYYGGSTVCAIGGSRGCYLDGSRNFYETTYNVTLNYQFDPDTMAYFTYSRGYRAGGFNIGASDPVSFAKGYAPESNLNYEVGLKRDWDFGFPVRTNVAAYIQDYTNIVRTLIPNALATTAVLINGPAAEIDGGELEIQAKPIKDLELDASWAYVHAYYTKPYFPLPMLQGEYLHFGLVPTQQLTLGATYNLPVDESLGTMSLNATYYYQSRVWFDDVYQPTYYPNTSTIPGINANDVSQAGYGTVDMRFGWKGIAGSELDFDAWVKNLTNTKYYTWGLPQSLLGVGAEGPGQPRFFGFDITYHFGGEAVAAPTATYTPPPARATVQASKMPSSYLVFFDFNKSDLTQEALGIVDTAAKNAAAAKMTQIRVTGHTDTVGSDAYNMRLSRRRAESVAAELAKQGIQSSEIEIVAKGKRDLLVPTADGVKEPQNRRVQIVYESTRNS